MARASTVLLHLAATFFIWASFFVVQIPLQDSGMIDFLAMVAFGSTVALWLVWAFNSYGSQQQQQAQSEKQKRSPVERDARLATLLELLSDEERIALKERLLDDLRADGEAVSLAALLEAQDERSRRHSRS